MKFNEDTIRIKMEELGLQQEMVNEIMNLILDSKQAELHPPFLANEALLVEEKNRIKDQIMVESDWKKRASLTAKLISMDLEI